MIIGKTLSGHTICGIFETPEYKEWWDNNISIRMDEAPCFYDNSVFVLKGSLNNFLQKTFSKEAPKDYGIYIKLKDDYSKNLKLLNSLNFYSSSFDGTVNTGSCFDHYKMHVYFSNIDLVSIDFAVNTFTSKIYFLTMAFIIVFITIFIVAFLVKLIHAILQSNKQSNIMSFKSSDLYNMIIFPIMVILYLLSLPLTWLLLIISNSFFSHSILYLNWMTFSYGLLFIICLSAICYLIMLVIKGCAKKPKETDKSLMDQ